MPARQKRRRKGSRARTARLLGAGQGSNLVVEMAARIGRDSGFYMATLGIVFPIGLINAIVLTRYLRTTQYGQLGLLFFASGMATVILNILFLRGTERRTWGATEEAVDVDQPDLVEGHLRARILGTGIVLSFIIAAIFVAIVIPFAPTLSQWLLGTRKLATAVVWAAVSGALGSTWRLVSNIGRWERRKLRFGISWMLRPIAALAISWPLVAAGHGVTGTMLAVTIGTALSVLAGLWVSRGTYELAFDRSALRGIAITSGSFATMVIGLHVLHTGDVFLLSRYATESQVGVYRLATNVTSVISYGVSAFLMAWGPLEFSSLFNAAYDAHSKRFLRAEYLHYYLIFGIFSVLCLGALATPLISLFAPSYAGAVGFVVITSVGYLGYGLLLVVARSSNFPHRYVVYGLSAVAGAAGLILTSIALAGPLGGYGVGIGDVVGALVGVSGILLAAGLWGQMPAASPFRLAGLLLVGGACWALGGPVSEHAGAFDVPLKIFSIILFPLLLVALRVVPVHHVRVLWAALRATLRREKHGHNLISQIPQLPRLDRQVLVAITRYSEPAKRVGALMGIPESEVKLRLISALRRLTAAGESTEKHDIDTADYLLAAFSVTHKDGLARTLWDEGVTPLELHKIETAFKALCGAPAKSWETRADYSGHELAESAWTVDPASLRLLELIGREGRPADQAAAELGIDPYDVDRRFVSALRAITGHPDSNPVDPLIAAFLVGSEPRPPAQQLWAAGVDPLDLHRLQLALESIRSLPRGRWRRRLQAAEEAARAAQEELDPITTVVPLPDEELAPVPALTA